MKGFQKISLILIGIALLLAVSWCIQHPNSEKNQSVEALDPVMPLGYYQNHSTIFTSDFEVVLRGYPRGMVISHNAGADYVTVNVSWDNVFHDNEEVNITSVFYLNNNTEKVDIPNSLSSCPIEMRFIQGVNPWVLKNISLIDESFPHSSIKDWVESGSNEMTMVR